jgi:hypothetical protein
MESWARKDNPGIYVYAPYPRNRWNPGAPTPLPRAHYVCRCGRARGVMGSEEVKALISEYLTHMATEHPDLPAVPKRQPGKRAA